MPAKSFKPRGVGVDGQEYRLLYAGNYLGEGLMRAKQLTAVAMCAAIHWAFVGNGAGRANTPNPFRQVRLAAAEAEVIETPPAPAGGDRTSRDRPIQALGVDIGLPPGKVPTSNSLRTTSAQFAGGLPRPWPTQVYQWQAGATRHQPLYFEEINAERYGYSRNWVCQPLVSTAHFFATIPALPYLKAANCPGECQYTLGHYRPGSCPPYRCHCWPLDGLGAAAEAGTIAWLVLVLP